MSAEWVHFRGYQLEAELADDARTLQAGDIPHRAQPVGTNWPEGVFHAAILVPPEFAEAAHTALGGSRRKNRRRRGLPDQRASKSRAAARGLGADCQ
jgi:hypothetical protein